MTSTHDIVTRDREAPTSGSAIALAPSLDEAIEEAWNLIAPLWPLKNFVAVNPYGGLVGRPFGEAVQTVDRVFHSRAIMPLDYHRGRHVEGAFSDGDLEAAADEVQAILPGADGVTPRGRMRTYVEALDQRTGNDWSRLVTEEIAKWCAARFDTGQASWRAPRADQSLWSSFRDYASIDRSPELRGLTGFRRYVAGLDADPKVAIAAILDELDVPASARPGFLARALASVRGWAGHVRYQAREAGLRGRDDGGARVEFLAIRLAFEGAARAARGRPEETWSWLLQTGLEASPSAEAIETRLVWQSAFERGYRRRLLSRLREGPSPDVAVGAPALQAVFCIDVRSEVFRRHLETISPHVQTLGFAGFFGFPVDYRRVGEEETAARCPALIAPSHEVLEAPARGSKDERAATRGHRRREISRHRAAQKVRLSTVSSFTFAETLGLWFGLRMLTDALQITHPRADGALFEGRARKALAPEVDVHECEHGGHTGLDAEARLELAEGALRGMGLVDDFAEIVLLCGHGSHTANNPYGSGLDCGACGGHAGDVNARVAAAVLNDPEVRKGLQARGIRVPDTTRFLAGRHVTTTDTVELYDTDGVDADRLEQLQVWLQEAGSRTRRERLGGMRRDPMELADPEQEVRRRSRDWSEVRPEWGLARNAAFVAARRIRTRGVDLEGRVFLHDYDLDKDPDRTVLTSIMTAPLVVASWINMQYYASTVDNDTFGSGNKVLHNVVGRHGVQLGNRGDLQVGLPMQSVHDGVAPYHEPIRLQVVIEAPPEDLDRVLEAQPSVRELVDNGWLTLLAWHRASDSFWRRECGGGWDDA